MKQYWLFGWLQFTPAEQLRDGVKGGFEDFIASFSTTHEAVKWVHEMSIKPDHWHIVDSLTGKITAKSL